VIRFTARTEVDKETRLVTLEDVTIAKADFPTAPDGGDVYLTALRQALSAQPLTIALDRLQAELEVKRTEDPGRIVQVKNDARGSSSASSRRCWCESMASRCCDRSPAPTCCA